MDTERRASIHREPPGAVVLSQWGSFAFLPHAATVVISLLIFVLASPSTGLAALSCTSGVFALWLALRTGGPYLTPSGVFMIASGVFIGAAGYYLGRIELDVAMVDVRNAALLALLSTVGISVVATACSIRWGTSWRSMAPDLAASREAFTPPRQFALRAVALVVLSQLPPAQAFFGSLAPALGLTGILMLSLAASSRRLRMRWEGDIVLVAVVVIVPAIWVALDFSGGGRIVVAGLGVAAFVGWNIVRPHSWQKIVLVMSIPVFLVVAGQVRLDDGDSTASNGSVLGDGEGLGSLYSPLQTWGEIIQPKAPDKEALLGPRWGATFYNTLVLPLPRSLWDDKPVGFGRELVVALEIRGVSENHSVAALVQGEWYANFGYPGLGLMVLVLGWLLALLDRAHARLVDSRLGHPVDWWRAVALMCVISSLADMYWVGSFTFFARGGLAAVAALAVGRLSTARQKRGAGSPSAQPAPVGGARP